MPNKKKNRKPATELPPQLRVKIEDREGLVPRKAYVEAKWKQMVEFGYSTLTLEEADAQVSALLEGKKFGDGLTVIGMFMQDEVLGQEVPTVDVKL